MTLRAVNIDVNKRKSWCSTSGKLGAKMLRTVLILFIRHWAKGPLEIYAKIQCLDIYKDFPEDEDMVVLR